MASFVFGRILFISCSVKRLFVHLHYVVCWHAHKRLIAVTSLFSNAFRCFGALHYLVLASIVASFETASRVVLLLVTCKLLQVLISKTFFCRKEVLH